MSDVILDMAMSLDGFAADRDGRSVYPIDRLEHTAELQQMIASTGAVIMGRRAYDMAQGDFTGYEYQVPIFVLTHRPPRVAARGENERLRFIFVTDGIESAVHQARTAARNRNVTVIGGPSTFQQCLQAELADEIRLRLIPKLLGRGLRLFGELNGPFPSLEKTGTTELPARVDLRIRRGP